MFYNNEGIVSAPSNIALVKYMGKVNAQSNLPTNPSLSFTLKNYRSFVNLREIHDSSDRWQVMPGPLENNFSLSVEGQEKFLRHLRRIKEKYGVKKNYLVSSTNNFPSDAGMASSASSFAALTKAAALVFETETGIQLNDEELSEMSRQGSGSSCRSFFSPWAQWDEKGARLQESAWPNLLHEVILISQEKKKVSSSEAHVRVLQSPKFVGRVERATKRFHELQSLLQVQSDENWKKMYQLVWDEFEDMHTLFETCPEPFTYRNDLVFQELKSLKELWEDQGEGPLVTMDAGANIHLLFRPERYHLIDVLRLWRRKRGLLK